MDMPDEKETYKFKDHAAKEKTPFICLFDFESFLPKSNRKNRICDHKPAAGFYIILNKDGKIVARKSILVTDTDKGDKKNA